jgi:hypothetical protein
VPKILVVIDPDESGNTAEAVLEKTAMDVFVVNRAASVRRFDHVSLTLIKEVELLAG